MPSFRHLSDARLVEEVHTLASAERRATAALIASLAEFDRRRLHLASGHPSLFDYCRKVLRLSEHEALNRIEAARAVRRFPSLLTALDSGALSLTAVRLLAPHLTADNCQSLVAEAEGRSTEAVRLLIAKVNPQPPVPSTIRKLPELKPVVAPAPPFLNEALPSSEAGDDAVGAAVRSTSESVPGPVESRAPVAPVAAESTCPPASRRSIVAPLSEAHYKLQVTISAAARERLGQIQALMRHRVPSGDPAAIIERALEVLHADLLKQKAAQVAKPRTGRAASEAKGRYIPAAVKREVWRRDHGRCAFIAPDGCRCGSEQRVEFHHVQPYAVGGDATVDNIELRCRAHNGFEWQRHIDLETASLVKPS